MPQANKAHAPRRHQASHHGLGGPHLGAAGQVTQPSGHVHGIAIAIAIDLDHLSTGQADMDFDPQRLGLGLEPLAVLAHQGHRRRHGLARLRKNPQHAVTQLLDHAPAMVLHANADALCELRHQGSGLLIAERFKQRRAAGHVCKHYGGAGTHVLLPVMDITAGLQAHVAAWGSHRRLQIARALSYTDCNQGHSYAATPGWTLTNVDTQITAKHEPVGNAVPGRVTAIACTRARMLNAHAPSRSARHAPQLTVTPRPPRAAAPWSAHGRTAGC